MQGKIQKNLRKHAKSQTLPAPIAILLGDKRDISSGHIITFAAARLEIVVSLVVDVLRSFKLRLEPYICRSERPKRSELPGAF